MVGRIITFFDKLEDKIRGRLSRKPILYALIGGLGVVLFWKGVWETIGLVPFLFGPGSIVLGIILLLMTGLLVSVFIGDGIILSGFRGEKKLVEKTEEEVRSEMATTETILEKLGTISIKIEHIEDIEKKYHHSRS